MTMLPSISHNFQDKLQTLFMTFQKILKHLVISEGLVRTERKAAFNFFLRLTRSDSVRLSQFCRDIFRLEFNNRSTVETLVETGYRVAFRPRL